MKMMKSYIKFFDKKKGWGYVTRTKESDDFIRTNFQGIPEDDIFFHFSDITMEGYKTLEKGQSITFSIAVDERSGGKKVKAIQVTPV